MSRADAQLREQVRARYATAAEAMAVGQGCGCDGCAAEPTNTVAELIEQGPCCSAASCAPETVEVDESFGAIHYDDAERGGLPAEAVLASLGCGNPVAVAQLNDGERVLDLGSGGGIDVLLSARRVGPTGYVYGVDMTDQMLELARANAAKAGIANVEFRKGTIEDIPLPDGTVDVVISNCVINLSVDKPAVLAQMFRVLRPGGRIGISDVVAEDHLSPADRAERGSYLGCIAGALSRQEYLDGLAAVGFRDASVAFTHEAAPDMHAAIIRAIKPAVIREAAS